MSYIQLNSINVASHLYHFVNEKVLPGLSFAAEDYWKSFESILLKHIPRNNELLNKRNSLQHEIDQWHRENQYNQNDLTAYKEFLNKIGYLLEPIQDFKVTLNSVDREVSTIAAPQLVVPINNARFAINAANARWGSLYDALYGTDMITNSGDTVIAGEYNEIRGEKVFKFCNQFLDSVIPLNRGSHAEVIDYRIYSDQTGVSIKIHLEDGTVSKLKNDNQFRGYNDVNALSLLFEHHDLHLELVIDKTDSIGSLHKAGVKDIVIEAAVTTIQDCEDSVAAVDIEDKILVYSNWLGLLKGNLSADMQKNGEALKRQLNPDRSYKDPAGADFSLPGRSLMLIRNTGMHMKSDLVLNSKNNFVPEGLIDALITVLISMHDLKDNGKYGNSKTGSIYIVKPKCHGPEEVAFSCEVFSDIEIAYGLAPYTIKIGVMDEERRTTVNLKHCIWQARERIIFINTGFLDRTGDEIHTSMLAGPMMPKAEIKNAKWMPAYEDWNVDTGLSCGLDGKAQIGKGMWAVPDKIYEMYKTKQVHPQAGANCAWVPSPTAATIHALHYHQVNVKKIQQELKQRKRANVDDILSIPLLADGRQLTDEEIQHELDNNAQGILGYVVKWIDQGIGCSKVPDINNTGLMEDRATLRISSQHMANWLKNGLCNEQQVIDTFKNMAFVVDQQNKNTPGYRDMAPAFESLAFKAALELVLKGTDSANGYTEEVLQAYRRKVKMH